MNVQIFYVVDAVIWQKWHHSICVIITFNNFITFVIKYATCIGFLWIHFILRLGFAILTFKKTEFSYFLCCRSILDAIILHKNCTIAFITTFNLKCSARMCFLWIYFMLNFAILKFKKSNFELNSTPAFSWDLTTLFHITFFN